jgi:anti-anti-sigma factor
MTRRNPAQRDADELAREISRQRDGKPAGGNAAPRRARARPERTQSQGVRLRPGAVHDSARAVPLRRAQNRVHRLELSGELRHDSAVQLEAELDALCEAGIGTLVLDLSRLQAIDATGARVITMRCALCRRRGMRIAVEGLGGQVRETVRDAGLLDGLPLAER